MADPAFYRQTSTEITAAQKRSDEIVTTLEKAYRRWEELEAIRLAAEPE